MIWVCQVVLDRIPDMQLMKIRRSAHEVGFSIPSSDLVARALSVQVLCK